MYKVSTSLFVLTLAVVPAGLLASCLSNDTVSYRLGRSATSSPLPCRLPHQPDRHHSGGRNHSLPAGLQCGPRGYSGPAAGAVDHGQRAPHPFLLHHPLRLTAAVPGSGGLSPGRVHLHVPGEEAQLLPGGVRYVLLFCCLLVVIPSPPLSPPPLVVFLLSSLLLLFLSPPLVLIPSSPLVVIPSPPLVLLPSPPLVVIPSPPLVVIPFPPLSPPPLLLSSLLLLPQSIHR